MLLDRLNPSLAPQEVRSIWARARAEITTGWQTEEHPRQRLTVADEREHAIFYLAEVLYRIVPAFYEEVAAALGKLYDAAVAADPPTVLRFGTWVGGDMEGSPDVHAKSIRETLARQQQVIINTYYNECLDLAQKLSQSASRVGVLPALTRRIEDYMTLLPGAQAITPSRHDRMPYRVFLGQIAERLRAAPTKDARTATRTRASSAPTSSSSVPACSRIAAGMRATASCGAWQCASTPSASISPRSTCASTRACITPCSRRASTTPAWPTRPAAERQEKLAQVLARDAGPIGEFDALGKRTLAVFDAVMQGRHRYGEEAVGYYVVSGAAGADDVLAPLVLARWANAYDKRTGEIGLDIAPQFESVSTLDSSGETIERLLADPAYRRHLDSRGRSQCVVVGYSHGSLVSGIAATRFAAYNAQRAVSAGASPGG